MVSVVTSRLVAASELYLYLRISTHVQKVKLNMAEIDLMHNDVTRLDAREECWS